MYRNVMMSFIIVAASLFAIILLNLCLYRLQKRSYNQVMESKREIRRMQSQKEQEDLREEFANLRTAGTTEAMDTNT